MNWLLFLFWSFQGRIKRLAWFLAMIAFVLASVSSEEALRWALDIPEVKMPPNPLIIDFLQLDNLAILMFFVFLWPGLAIDIKRLHDMNLSGWFALAAWVPFAGLTMGWRIWVGAVDQRIVVGLATLAGLIIIAYFVVLVAVKGTHGRNRFGPEPE